MTLDQRLAALAESIRELGIGAAIDPADLSPPGVLVGVDSVAFDTLAGGPAVTASLDVLVGDTGIAGAFRSLGVVLDALTVLPVDAVSAITNQAGQTIGWRATIDLP